VSNEGETPWTFSFENLPTIDNNANRITYSVEEAGVYEDEGGVKTYAAGGNIYDVNIDGYNIYNTLQQDSFTIPVSKTWRGPTGEAYRPAVAITLGRKVGTTVEEGFAETVNLAYSADATWTGVSGSVEKYDGNRNEYEYFIASETIDGGTVSYSDSDKTISIANGASYDVQFNDSTGNYNVRNTVRQELVEVTGVKTWGRSELATVITVILLADGVPVTDKRIVLNGNETTPWSYSFGELPKYALGEQNDGHIIVYTVKEVGESGGSILLGSDTFYVTYSDATDAADNVYTRNIENSFDEPEIYYYQLNRNYTTVTLDANGAEIDRTTVPVTGNRETYNSSTSKTAIPADYTDYDGNVYSFTDGTVEGAAATAYTVELSEPDHVYTIVLNYIRTVRPELNPNPNPGTIGGGGGITPATPAAPSEDITDEPTPLADMILPDGNDDETYILDEDTPLADLPQTGAVLPAGAGSPSPAQAAGTANAVLPGFRKDDDNSGAVV
jgi:hypothetical protein